MFPMGGICNSLRSKVSAECCVDQCGKEGCVVHIANHYSSYVLIDFDCKALSIGKNEKRCDYLFASERFMDRTVAIIEMKKGRETASHVTKQLQSGARHSEHLVPHGYEFRFLPIFVHGKSLRKQERREFAKKSRRIRFRNQSEKIRVIRCGSSLPIR